MNINLLMMMFGFKAPVRSVTYTGSVTWTAPADASHVDLSGYGAVGVDGYDQYYYRVKTDTYANDGGVSDPTYLVSSSTSGRNFYNPDDQTVPSDYCDDPIYGGSAYTVTCYTHLPGATHIGTTAGASSTGFGQSFPGSLGNTPQTVTTFTGIAITPSTAYSLVIPSGGSITITY